MQWQLVGFATISAVLVAVSWRSLRRPRSHGFPRLFAWECIAALFLLVVPDWWREPLAWHQLVSWVLMTLSIIPAVWGFVLLARSGRQVPGRRAADPALLPFEATSRLVTTGIYRYIRHPLYSSLLLLTWGDLLQAADVGGSPACPGGHRIPDLDRADRRSRVQGRVRGGVRPLPAHHQEVHSVHPLSRPARLAGRLPCVGSNRAQRCAVGRHGRGRVQGPQDV